MAYEAYCWGNNAARALGSELISDSSVPVQVQGLNSGVTAISAGNLGSCAIKNGNAYCWGLNSRGQLGNTSAGEVSAVPMKVEFP